MQEPIVSVTGTNGKSTTCKLIELFLNESGLKSWLGGNYGEPLIEYVRKGEKADTVVAEVSSFQLEHSERFNPQNIVFTNLAENHQDRYRSIEDYVNAKRGIFQNTNQATTSILNADDNAVVELARDPAVQRGRIFYFSRKPSLEPQIMTIGGAVTIKDELRVRTGPDIDYYTVKNMKMRGKHSIDNIMAAILAAREHGTNRDGIQRVIDTFPGMAHRLERVRRVGGVEFFNDSKATNFHAVALTLDAFDENLILIMGGKDTGLSYEPLREAVRPKVKNLILFGEAKKRINRDLGDYSETFLIGTFEEAVLISYQKSRIGDTVLLSPGCSSFDMFDSRSQRRALGEPSRFAARRSECHRRRFGISHSPPVSNCGGVPAIRFPAQPSGSLTATVHGPPPDAYRGAGRHLQYASNCGTSAGPRRKRPSPSRHQHHHERHRPEESVLNKVVQENLETFLTTVRAETGHPLPDFVEKEFYEYLRCGILAHGFVRVQCTSCQDEKLVAFSCKRRGFCPSCGGRRMSETAVHLVDRVLPAEPIRQWVLSFPFQLRLLLAIRPKVMAAALRITHECIAALLRKKAGLAKPQAQTGAVTLIQRFGGSINLNVHFHQLFIDGVYNIDSEGAEFHPAAPPTREEIAAVLAKIIRRLARHLERHGIIAQDEELQIDLDDDDSFGKLQAGAVSYRFALGPNKGKKALTLKTVPERDHDSDHGLVAKEAGFSLHAGVASEGGEREKLEKLCRYVARPPIAIDRLRLNDRGEVIDGLKKPCRKGRAPSTPEEEGG